MFKYYYDRTNPKSIELYAKNLIGKTFNEVINIYSEYIFEASNENTKHKGNLGDLIEKHFFHYSPNSNPNADFKEAGVELKVTPYKQNKNGSFSAKERLVLTMINYNDIVKENFYNSHLWAKCSLILLVYYLYNKDTKNKLDYRIDYAKLFSPPEKDLEIIKQDFYTIINKIKSGQAHTLSESDTNYLGAVTKAANSTKLTSQPFSDKLAKPRAFSFKTSYMTYVLNNYIIPNKDTYIKNESIISCSKDLKNKTFNQIVIDKLSKFIGKSKNDLIKEFKLDDAKNNKAILNLISLRMLGVKSNSAEEFIKANIKIKALRINHKNKIVESMSLPAFKFKDLINEDWETSNVFKYFDEQKFLFVVFKEDSNGNYIFSSCKFWNMPYEDLNIIVKDGWSKIQNTLKSGVILKKGKFVSNNFPKKSDNPIIHIRPHAQKSAYIFKDGTSYGNINRDANELPDGQWMTTQSFWLNNSYILDQL